MLRNAIFALGIAAAAVLVVPGAAQAADDSYTPSTPTAPTLSGSAAFVECVGNVPWIQFEVDAVDPDNQMSHQQVSLYLANGANSVELQLGTLSNNHLSGRVLWPGAATDGAGNGTAWPGWEQVNGEWVETAGNFGWTRGNLTAELRVNPSLSVPLSYPAATSSCAQPAGLGLPLSAGSGLAATGSTVPAIALGVGGAAVLLGGAMVFKRRQHKH